MTDDTDSLKSTQPAAQPEAGTASPPETAAGEKVAAEPVTKPTGVGAAPISDDHCDEAPSDSDRDGLTERQRRFVSEYLVDRSATKAAMRAGYSVRTAGTLLNNPLIAAEIARRTAAAAPTDPAIVTPLLREAYSALRMASDNNNPAHMAAVIRVINEIEERAKPADAVNVDPQELAVTLGRLFLEKGYRLALIPVAPSERAAVDRELIKMRAPAGDPFLSEQPSRLREPDHGFRAVQPAHEDDLRRESAPAPSSGGTPIDLGDDPAPNPQPRPKPQRQYELGETESVTSDTYIEYCESFPGGERKWAVFDAAGVLHCKKRDRDEAIAQARHVAELRRKQGAS
jgi:hypothetical protein